MYAVPVSVYFSETIMKVHTRFQVQCKSLVAFFKKKFKNIVNFLKSKVYRIIRPHLLTGK